jgi:hypothetical protein
MNSIDKNSNKTKVLIKKRNYKRKYKQIWKWNKRATERFNTHTHTYKKKKRKDKLNIWLFNFVKGLLLHSLYFSYFPRAGFFCSFILLLTLLFKKDYIEYF